MDNLYLASDTDFLRAVDIYSKYLFGGPNENDKPIQVCIFESLNFGHFS